MFEDALLESSPRRASLLRRIHDLFSAFAGTLLFESMLVGLLILVPLIYTQALPRQMLIVDIRIPPPPGSPPGQPLGRRSRPAPHPTVDPFATPVRIPKFIAQIVEPPQPPQAEAGPVGPFVLGAPSGLGGGGNSILEGMPWGKEPPPPPPIAPAAPKPRMVRRGGDVVAARALYHPPPIYPPLATMARVQGTVVLQAIIGLDGTIKDLKVLSGHPLLARAAIDAVKTWRYQPTMLNTEPVEVLTEIDVNFRLGE